MQILHNPRCRKSRETLAIIQESGKEPEVIEYLKNPPSVETLGEILALLGKRPLEIVRRGEAIFKENFRGKDFSDEEWLQILHENPKLIERPIVIEGKRAVIGRPPENVKDLL